MRHYKFLLASLLMIAVVLPAAAGLPMAAFAQDATPEATPIMGQDMIAACPTPTALPATVNVGAIFALSGAASVYGVSQQEAVKLAVQQINDWHYLGDSTTLNVN